MQIKRSFCGQALDMMEKRKLVGELQPLKWRRREEEERVNLAKSKNKEGGRPGSHSLEKANRGARRK